jgi:tRNA-dihydrouridine synthase A
MPENQNNRARLRGLAFSVAPMMDWTDRHCRFFHRQLTSEALLYTEMVTTGAIIHGPRDRLLAFSPQEHPVSLQFGGSEPAELAEAIRIAEPYGYDEYNLNVGCPSDRVQSGRFGACLMLEPKLVARCVSAMKAVTARPVTVKCRIGVDDQDPEQALDALADAVIDAGVDVLVVHARKAWLKGLSPRENRDVPPLDYSRVYRLKQRVPDVPVVINGGIKTLAEAKAHMAHVDGVMLGRAAYQDPALLIDVDPEFFGRPAPSRSPRQAVEAMIPYIEQHIASGGKLSNVTKHVLGAFPGLVGARAFRRHLSVHAPKAGAGADVLAEALSLIRDDAAFAAA